MPIKTIDIVHIYSGTSGSSGLYLERIARSLNKNFRQEYFVNYYFPFPFGKKVFYRYTDMLGPNHFRRHSKIRLFIRYIELMFSLLKIIVFLARHRVGVVNYSVISTTNLEFVFFLIIKKLFKINLVLTCHDVVPFDSYLSVSKGIIRRQKFLNLADILLVHNKNSINDISEYYGKHLLAKVVNHEFPIMDLKKLPINDYRQNLLIDKKEHALQFAFVGHLRKEKGIQILIEAWKLKKSQNATLFIAGNIPPKLSYDFSNLKNVYIKNKFLSDIEYNKIISSSNFIILPYQRGTNSGIPSSAISVGTIPIVSDIPMFKNNSMLDSSFFFNASSAYDLAQKLDYFIGLDENARDSLIRKSLMAADHYDFSFDKEINEVYKKITGGGIGAAIS